MQLEVDSENLEGDSFGDLYYNSKENACNIIIGLNKRFININI